MTIDSVEPFVNGDQNWIPSVRWTCCKWLVEHHVVYKIEDDTAYLEDDGKSGLFRLYRRSAGKKVTDKEWRYVADAETLQAAVAWARHDLEKWLAGEEEE